MSQAVPGGAQEREERGSTWRFKSSGLDFEADQRIAHAQAQRIATGETTAWDALDADEQPWATTMDVALRLNIEIVAGQLARDGVVASPPEVILAMLSPVPDRR